MGCRCWLPFGMPSIAARNGLTGTLAPFTSSRRRPRGGMLMI